VTLQFDDGVLEHAFADLAPIAARPGSPRSFKGPHRAKNIRLVAEFLDRSGILEQIEAWRIEDDPERGKRGGRPALLGDRQVLGLMLLHALADEPYLITELNTTMRERLDPIGRELLGLPEPDLDQNPRNTYDCLYRAIGRMLAPMDSAPFTTGRRLTAEGVEQILRKRAALGPLVLAERARRMNQVTAQLLHACWLSIPSKYRNRWKGTLCVDSTVVPAWGKKGTPRTVRNGGTHSPEFDGGWYVREEEDHADKGGTKGKRTRIYGYETHVVVASGDGVFPRIALAATLDKPGHRIAENALACVAQVAGRGLPASWFVGDRAYFPNSIPEKLQIPLRALGYKLVFDYRSDQLGIQGQHAGAPLVDGTPHCPGMPQALIDASKDYRAGRIGEEVYRARIEARRAYQLQTKTKPDPNGVEQRRCPANSLSPTVDCSLKPRPGEGIALGVPKLRPQVIDPPQHPDRICTNRESVSFGPDPTLLKYLQDVPYETPEWAQLYHGPRNTIEGFNGMFKDENHADAASAGKRRARGFTLHWLTTALNLLATNLRRLKDFLNQQADQARKPPSSPDKRRRAKRLTDYRPDPNAPPVTGPAAA
jgi:hypothetical protein